MASSTLKPSSREQLRASTPLRCPLCGGELEQTMIRDLGSVTPTSRWELHAGYCPEHGWFQAEVVGKPPRDIFAVTRPFGAARRVVMDDREFYQFPTVWNDVDGKVRMDKYNKVDPYDPQYWKPRS